MNGSSISKQLMLLLAGFALIITLVLAGVLDNLFSGRAQADIGHEYSELALQTTDTLDRSLFERYREVRLLADRAGLGGPDATDAEKRRLLEEMQRTYANYAWLGLTDMDGRVLVSANRLLEGADVSQRPWFGNALKGVHLTDVHDAKLLSKLLKPGASEPMRFVDIAFPYRDANGRVAGVFGAHLNLDWAREIEKSVTLPLLTRKHVDTLVLASDMTVIIGPKPLLGTRIALADPAFRAGQLTGYALERFADGRTHLVGYSKSQGHSFSPGLGWTVLVHQDVEEAYAPVAQFRRQVVVAGACIALLFAALAWWLARRISRPLMGLAESARRIESGESDNIGPVKVGYREIGMLGASLRSLIGKLKANEASMREADRRKDEFLATLAHELRNPLAPISSAADLLRLTRVDEAQQRRIGEMIGRQTRHMTGMVDDLLDVARVTRGQVTLERQPVGMQDVVSEAVEQVAPQIAAKGHRLASQLPAQALMVMGDRKRLVQVVANLLDNAAKYTPGGGHIALALALEEGRVVLRLRDDGIGMSADLIEHAFELFTQETRKVDRSTGGLGVGLALSKRLVELHEGSLTVHSGGPGQGSEFVVALPALAPEDAPGPAAAEAAQAAPAQGLPVLIVDDNTDAADTLGMVVESLGYPVHIEYEPLVALEYARTHPVRVCLLDIGMPVMDGYELARHLRALPGMEGALLVAVSGYRPGSTGEGNAPFDHRLVKPADTDQLAALLAETVA
ncbi:ATP-binding protein [Massilia sp. SYSU DXS3249]